MVIGLICLYGVSHELIVYENILFKNGTKSFVGLLLSYYQKR